MRIHPKAVHAMSFAAMSALCVAPADAEAEPVEVITNEPIPGEPPRNLPGETNRQFAARLRAEQAA